MRQFIDVTGKTEDEAISRALEQLKLDRDDVSVEILERAKAGFLGLGSCPAKVRVSYGEDDAPAPEQLTYSPQNGVILLVMAFLISPMGLPLAAIWLMGKVQSLKFAIQELVYG